MTNTQGAYPGSQVNGWTFDPSDETWTAKIGAHRWLAIPGTLDDAPLRTPAQVRDSFDRDAS